MKPSPQHDWLLPCLCLLYGGMFLSALWAAMLLLDHTGWW
jgi:hypothetical protein